jgi:hypothetical protein
VSVKIKINVNAVELKADEQGIKKGRTVLRPFFM